MGASTRRLLHFFWFDYHRRQHDTRVYEVSNVEIQKWAERLLEQRYDVHSTSCVSQGRVTVSKADILIGSPTWDPLPAARTGKTARDWVRDNRLSESAACHPNTYILTPWVPTFPPEWVDYMPWYESQLQAAKLVFGICGPIWYERTLALDDTTVQGRIKPKLVRLNMAVNYDVLSTISKSGYNPIGQRKLLHVSNLGSYKGLDLLLESTSGVSVPTLASKSLANAEKGDVKVDVRGTLYPVHNIGAIDNGDEVQVRTVVDTHDYYIHTAYMDAQATTVLEYAARGLIPLVTPESGFDCEDAIYLTDSATRNREIIDHAMHMPDEELTHRSAKIRERIRTRHSWPLFFDTIGEHIERTYEG